MIQSQLFKFNQLKDILFILLGVISAGIGLKGFLLPNVYFDGGATGVSLLINSVTKINVSVLIVIINIPFVYIGSRQINKNFAIKSMIAILSLAVVIHFITIPAVTSDKLLIAVFGGFFLGLGTGLSIRGGAVIDGTEVLAIAVSRRSTLSVGDFIAIFNCALFLIAALVINIETAMYSMLTYIAASKTVDFIINGIEEYIALSIISDKSLEIKTSVTDKLGLGVTVYNATGGYGKSGSKGEDRKVLYCVVTRLEVSKLLAEVDLIDPDAFIIQQTIRDTRGGMIKKRPLH